MGTNFVGGQLACAMTPNSVNEIDYVTLQYGIYDDLHITQATDATMDDTYSTDWDFDTVLHAAFNGTTDAGNITSISVRNTSHLVLKSRLSDSFTWKTLAVKEVSSKEDFVVDYNDYSIPNSEVVQYAIVPIQYGTEGNYITVSETSEFESFYLIEKETVYGTRITDGFCDTTRNIPSANVEMINYKYPMFVRNSLANYDTGTCTGSFIPLDEYACLMYDEEFDLQRIKYQRNIMNFLADGKPKILKVPDGRLWIVQVTPNPTDTADITYNDRDITFSWVEVGDVNSEEDLYYLGLSDVTSEWWSNLTGDES